jgi:hypothetical protein
MPPLFVAAGNVSPGDQPPPFAAETSAGERVEVVGFTFEIDEDECTLPILFTESGARYLAWARSGPELTGFGQHHVETTFLLARVADLRAELEVLGRARARVSSSARDELLEVIAPLEIDHFLILKELERKGVTSP